MKIAVCGLNDYPGRIRVINFIFMELYRISTSVNFDRRKYDNGIVVDDFIVLPNVKTDLQGDDALFYIFSANDLPNGFKEFKKRKSEFTHFCHHGGLRYQR